MDPAAPEKEASRSAQPEKYAVIRAHQSSKHSLPRKRSEMHPRVENDDEEDEESGSSGEESRQASSAGNDSDMPQRRKTRVTIGTTNLVQSTYHTSKQASMV